MMRPLKEDQIRILHLLPRKRGRPGSSIDCTLEIVRLSDAPEYEAVSYRWGTMEDAKGITVDGRKTQITRTLYDCLKRLQLRNEKRALWADQLCIDQTNDEERIRQVRLMDQVYRLSSRCLIWFDEMDDSIPITDALAAFDLLTYIAGKRGDQIPVTLRDQKEFDRAMHAIDAISVWKQPWWQRVWTLQEAVLSSRKLLLWGPLKLDWHILELAAEVRLTRWPEELTPMLASYPAYGGPEFSGSAPNPFEDLLLHITWLDRTIVGKQHAYDVLLQIFMIWRGKRHSSDMRDMIFGFLGLCQEDRFEHLGLCDYSTSTSSLYAAATLDLIVGYRSLMPLIMAPRVQNATTKDMPSWAIDQAASCKYTTDAYYLYWGYLHAYDACAGRHLDVDVLRNTARNGQARAFSRLSLRGVKVDEVAYVADNTVPFQWPNEPPNLFEVLRHWYSFALKHLAQTSTEVEQTFGRLLLGDRIRNHEQWPQDYLSEYGASVAVKSVLDGVVDERLWCEPKLLWAQVCNQSLYVTTNGLLGLGHPDTTAGDEVWIFDGGNVPFTLRKPNDFLVSDAAERNFMAYSYVQGLMLGEFFQGDGATIIGETVIIE